MLSIPIPSNSHAAVILKTVLEPYGRSMRYWRHTKSLSCLLDSWILKISSLWEGIGLHYNGCDGVSNHQPHHCLLNHSFRRRSKKTSKLRVTGLRVGNSPMTGEFLAQRASIAENVSIWWRHHGRAKSSTFAYKFMNLLCSCVWNGTKYNIYPCHPPNNLARKGRIKD